MTCGIASKDTKAITTATFRRKIMYPTPESNIKMFALTTFFYERTQLQCGIELILSL